MAISVATEVSNPLISANTQTPKLKIIIEAISIILLIGSLVAAGLLFPRMGYPACAIAGGGIALTILSFALVSYCRPEPTPPSSSATFTPLLNQQFEASEMKIAEHRIADIPLEFLFKPPTLSDRLDPRSWYHDSWNVMEDQKNQEAMRAVHSRIQALNQAFNFEERFKRLDCDDLRVKDLMGPLSAKSSLLLKMMLDEELVTLTLSSVSSIKDKKVWKAFGPRLIALSRQHPQYTFPALLTQESVGTIPLIHLPKLKAEMINAHPQLFPPLTLLLIETEELQKIELTKLSDEHLQILFSCRFYDSAPDPHNCYYPFVQRLKPEQVNGSLQRISQMQINKYSHPDHRGWITVFTNHGYELLDRLSETQILHLDLSLMTPQIFNVIFTTTHTFSGANKLLPKFPLASIYRLMRFFPKDSLWHCIGEAHALAFEFSQIADDHQRKEVFNKLFPWYPLKKCTLERIQELSPLFSDLHWRAIREEHAGSLDYSRIPEANRQRVLNLIFEGGGSYSSAALYLPKLSSTQKAFVKPYLSPEALKHL